MHHGHGCPTHGWSELAATNAPVADEPIEAIFRMNENPILPTRIFFFFSTSSLPQNFPLSYLPPTSPRPTYHLPPPSYLPPTNPSPLTPSPELLAPETLSGSELGAWSRLRVGASLELGAWNELGAWSGWSQTHAGPR
jgi:hypothetical protein